MGISTEITQSGSGTTPGNFVLVEKQTLGADAQAIDFDSLDILTDSNYLLIIKGANNSGGANNLSVYFNDDLTATNYYCQMHFDSNAVQSVSRENLAMVSTLIDDYSIRIFVSRTLTGYLTAFCESIPQISSGIQKHITTLTTASAKANLTNINLRTTAANGFKSGTTVVLYKITEV